MKKSRRSPLARGGSILAVSLLVCTHGLRAEAPAFPEQWMDWKNNYANIGANPFKDCRISKEMAAEWDRTLQRLTATIARLAGRLPAEAYAAPSGGVDVTESGSAGASECARLPIAGFVRIPLWPATSVVPPSGGNGRARLKAEKGETLALSLQINGRVRLDRYELKFLAQDTSGIGFYRRTGTFHGYPIVGDNQIVIAPTGHSPAVVPAPLARVLPFLIPFESTTLAEQEAGLKSAPDQAEFREVRSILNKAVTAGRARLDALKSLERMSAAEKSAPAYLKFDPAQAVYVLQTQPGPDTQPLMMPNPDYYDAHLARTVPQLLVIRSTVDLGKPPAPAPDPKYDPWLWVRQLIDKVDWNAVAKSELH